MGSAAVYEAGDQRNPPDADKPENQTERFEEGKENSHQENDSSQCLPPHKAASLVCFYKSIN